MVDKADKKEEKEAVKEDKTSKTKSTKKTKAKKTDDKTAQIEALGAKLSELNDKHLRLQAEFDNYRKRTLNEKMELMKSGGEDILTSLLPVMDNFERAMTAAASTDDVKAVKEGIDLIYSSFKDYLTKKGVKEIEAKEQVFDTDFHEALTKIPAPNSELKGKVVDVIEKGYMLNEKVIRFAKVVVGE
jgi:molecular chaperone GrpE